MSDTLSETVLEALSGRLAEEAGRARPLLVGVTGSVAVGKSTFSRQLSDRLSRALEVDAVSTDGFLLPNAVLDAQGLSLRKGFPESFDAEALFAALAGVREGPWAFPGYSHTTYDVDPALTREVGDADILILEGLGFSPFPDGRSLADAVDVLIYLDASEADLEAWFVQRFKAHWRLAERDPTSFYAQFRSMDEDAAAAFGRRVWEMINLPNLRDHIIHARSQAHIVLCKSADHTLHWAA